MINAMEETDILVIGGGAAGLAAAESLSARRRVLLVEREERLGGVLLQCVHRGFGGEQTGPAYAAGSVARLAKTAVQVRTGTHVLSLAPDRTALLSSPRGLERVRFDRCVLATGCRERTIHALPVAGTRPAGIFTAGTVQRLLLDHGPVGERIVVLGSGDIGQIVARQLVQSGRRVVAMVEQRDRLGGLARNRRDCVEAYHIPVLLRSTVDEILGEGRISGVVVRDLDTGRRRRLVCDTLLTALGLVPDQDLCRGLGADLPDWLALCGNCDYVHEMVDGVVREAAALGAAWGETF